MIKYMVDTNIFNHIVEGKITHDDLPSDGSYFVTYIQYDELKLPDYENEKKKRNLDLFEIIPKEELHLHTTLCGFARVGKTALGNGELYTEIKNKLDEKRKKANNFKDALIGEVAIEKGMILLTHDQDFLDVVNELGGIARRID